MISNPFTGETLNVFCPTGEGGGVDPTCSPSEGGGAGKPKAPKPLKAPTPQGVRKIFDSVGAELSGAGSADVLDGKIKIGTVKADTRGFKFKKALINKEEVHVDWKSGAYFSESKFKQALDTFEKAAAKLQEAGYEVQRYPNNNLSMTVRKPRSFTQKYLEASSIKDLGKKYHALNDLATEDEKGSAHDNATAMTKSIDSEAYYQAYVDTLDLILDARPQ